MLANETDCLLSHEKKQRAWFALLGNAPYLTCFQIISNKVNLFLYFETGRELKCMNNTVMKKAI